MTTAPNIHPLSTSARSSNSETAAADGFRALSDLPREHGFEPLQIDGTIPDDLRGTIYRNGASLFSSGGERYGHWFDGDGGLSAVRFAGGTARGSARIIESEGLKQERAAGRRLYGGFGTVQPGLLRRLRGAVKNTANTAVMSWNDRLFAMMEACPPTEIDPETLATLGETDLGGVVPRSFSAHPHWVGSRNAFYNFGVRYGKQTMLDLFELPAGGQARLMGSLPLGGATLIHDFIASDDHLIFFVPPLRLRILRAFLGIASFAESFAWRPELGTEVLVVPIDDPAHPIRFETEAFYQWHYGNAFERGDELVVDFVRYPDFSSNEMLTALFRGEVASGQTPSSDSGVLHRATIDLRGKNLRSEARWDRPCEFPRVSPHVEGRAYRYLYAAAHGPDSDPLGFQDTVAKIDLESGSVSRHTLPAGQYTSEPVFVPRSANPTDIEDDGYLLALIYDAASHSSHCAVYDARDLDAGPLARAHFDHHIPPRFHGVWVPSS